MNSKDEGENSDGSKPHFCEHLTDSAHEFPRLYNKPQPTTPLGKREALVPKYSCPLQDRNYEGEVFESAKRCFGVPDVVTTYTVPDEKGRQITSCFLSIYEVKQWGGEKKISQDATTHFNNSSRSPPNQERIRVRSIIITAGKPLTQAALLNDPLKIILHAITGRGNIFKKGWLRRDVSFGNAMICDSAERPLVTSLGEKVKTLTEEKYVGIISDGDHATVVEPKDDANSANRSGTLPFLSLRLLDLWSDNSANDINENIHTAIDDLESFMWLIIWVILHRTKTAGESNKAHGLRSREVNWLKYLTIWDHAAAYKGSIECKVQEGRTKDFSPEMALTLPLLKTLVALSSEGSRKIRNEIRGNTMTVERHMKLAEEYYRKYAEAIIDFLPKLKQ